MADVKANTAWDQLRKWGLWLLLGLGALLALVCWLLPTSKKGKPEILRKAKDGARAIKENRQKELKAHKRRMAVREKELETIGTIEDERERLQALADFANRRR